jgi:hypothetical protein
MGPVKSLLRIQRKAFVELDLGLIRTSPWAYFSFKAARFLVIGANIYRKADYFHFPLEECNEQKLKDGCEQIIYHCAGLPTPKTSFNNLCEIELENLFEMFHFNKVGDTQYFGNNIFEMHITHKMNSYMENIIYFKQDKKLDTMPYFGTVDI